MLRQVGELYRGGWRFALACPLLFAVPVVAELIQHAAELHIGMYESFARFEATGSDPLRTATGAFKTLALMLPAYWFVRYIGNGESAAAAKSLDARSLRLFAPVMAWAVTWSVAFMFGGTVMAAWGVGTTAVFNIGVGVFLSSIVLETYLAPWKAAAPLGNARIGFGRSIGLVRGHLLWSLAVFVLAFLPLMVVHYGLAVFAIGRPMPVVVAVLVADALVVGLLANVLVGINFVIAGRVTAAKGVRLLPEAERDVGIGTMQPA